MAIKINLLPQSYALEKARNRWIAGMAGLLGLTCLSIGLLYASDKKMLEKRQADAEAVKLVSQQTATANSATEAANQAKSSIKNVVDFMADASKSGPERAAFLDLFRRYIFSGAVISELDVSNGTDAKLTATVTTPNAYARFLLALRQGTKDPNSTRDAGKVFDTLPVGSGVRGYPDGRILPLAPNLTEFPQPIIFPIKVDAQGKLKSDPNNPRNNLLYVPAEPGGTVAAAVAQGAGGAPGAAPAAPMSGSGSASPSASPAAS